MEDKELADLRNSVRTIDKELAALLKSGWPFQEVLPSAKSRRKSLCLTVKGKKRTSRRSPGS